MRSSVILLVVFLAVMTMIPMVSTAENVQNSSEQQKIVLLFEPIDKEIQNMTSSIVDDGDISKITKNATEISKKIVKTHEKNLDQILDLLEEQTELKVSDIDRSYLKQLFVEEHMQRVSWTQLKKNMGVKEEDLETLYPKSSKSSGRTTGAELMSIVPCPYPVLAQVSADISGGIGLDGRGIPYITNGGNQVLALRWDTLNYDPRILCEVIFQDEDCAHSSAADALYDAERLVVYGTIQDTQGFFIYNPDSSGYRHIEFGNDWDNGYAYGTVLGQHGYKYLTWLPTWRVYVSNVWNHAMGLTDRNPNMAKTLWYF